MGLSDNLAERLNLRAALVLFQKISSILHHLGARLQVESVIVGSADGVTRSDPRFDSPFERRRLRILKSLFLAVGRMNGKSSFYRGSLRIMARLGDAVALRQCWVLKGDRCRRGEHPFGLGCLGCSGGTQG